MQPKTFLLFSQNNEETVKLLKEVSHGPGHSIEVIDDLELAYEKILKDNIKCFLLNVMECELKTVNFVQKIKSAADKTSIIVFCSKILPEIMSRLASLKNVMVLEKPVKDIQLDALFEKIMAGGDISQRVHKRYPTRQIIKIEKISSREVCMGEVFNISKGGAYVEVIKGRLTQGDVVRLSIKLDLIAKDHTLHAGVVWAIPKGINTGCPGAGLRFMNAEEVYSNLLEKFQ